MINCVSAAMGGERGRAALQAFEALFRKALIDAVVADFRAEAAAHGCDSGDEVATDVSSVTRYSEIVALPIETPAYTSTSTLRPFASRRNA